MPSPVAPTCTAPLPLATVLRAHRDRFALLWAQTIATCGSAATRARAEEARDAAGAWWDHAIGCCEADADEAIPSMEHAASLARRWGDDAPEQAALAALDDAPLCPAPATTTRTIEGLTCALCAAHAAELDAEQARGEVAS